MSTKTIAFKTPTHLPKPAEDWIGAVTPAPVREAVKPDGPTKRLTVDIPEDLHRRIKVDCAGKGTQISDAIRDILINEYPAT